MGMDLEGIFENSRKRIQKLIKKAPNKKQISDKEGELLMKTKAKK